MVLAHDVGTVHVIVGPQVDRALDTWPERRLFRFPAEDVQVMVGDLSRARQVVRLGRRRSGGRGDHDGYGEYGADRCQWSNHGALSFRSDAAFPVKTEPAPIYSIRSGGS